MEIRESTFSMRLSGDLKVALKQLADSENRTMSAMANLILLDWFKERGLLRPEKPDIKITQE